MMNKPYDVLPLLHKPNLEVIRPEIEKVEEKFVETNHICSYEIKCDVGMGHTIGNSLRRVLMTNLPGTAIVAIKINGANHIFEAISGIKETVQEIILRLRNLFIRISKDLDCVILTLKKTNNKSNSEMIVYASDIESEEGVVIVNEQLEICTLDVKASVNMELLVSRGMNFVNAQEHQFNREPSQFIVVDSVFSPVLSCSYEVHSFTGGKRNFDRIFLNITTNGTISPDEVLQSGAKTLMDNFSCFIDGSQETTERENVEESPNDLLRKMIINTTLSVRTKNCLLKNNIETIADLVEKTEAELRAISGLGDVCVTEIQMFLSELGLFFGMNTKRKRII